MLYVSQPPDATKNIARSAEYGTKQKQSEFETSAKKILGFERFLSKIRDMEKNCLLKVLLNLCFDLILVSLRANLWPKPREVKKLKSVSALQPSVFVKSDVK